MLHIYIYIYDISRLRVNLQNIKRLLNNSLKCWDLPFIILLYIFLYLHDDEIFSERNPMSAVDVLFSMTVDN